MKVRVKFFGAPREGLGRREIEQELPPGSTVKELINLLTEQYPVLVSYSQLINVAVNRRYAALETELHDGDEVACLPPVGGG